MLFKKNNLLKISLLCFLVALSVISMVACNKNIGDNLDNNSNNQGSVSSELPQQQALNDFASLSQTNYNVNDKNVSVDLYYRYNGEATNNPNVGQGLMLYRALKFKEANPDVDVYAGITSFHFSVVASVCVKKDSPYFGYMRSLYDKEYDSDGFYRISYLAVECAKKGIYTTVIGQIDATAVLCDGVYKSDYSFEEYFNNALKLDADIPGKKVADFLNFRVAKWTSYGDKAGSDMMHVKTCYVSNWLDDDGIVHGNAVWFGSINVDGITSSGLNGNDGSQSGIIICEHDDIFNVTKNYVSIMSMYCGQEEISQFRYLVNKLNTEQIAKIKQGEYESIPLEERIVYLGSPKDDVFELYFTPLGGSVGTWDTLNNPFCKYIEKLKPYVSGKGYILLSWNNVKFNTNFEFVNILCDAINYSFTNNKRVTNRLYFHLPGYDTTTLNQLVVNQDIGFKMINENLYYPFHIKDLQISYIENGKRHYVSVFNSLNFHQGSMSYQTNFVLVINETKDTHNNVYVDFGKVTSQGCITENDRV